MRAFFYVYILVSQGNKTIHYTGVTRDSRSTPPGTQSRRCPHTSKHGRGESRLRWRSNPKARREHLKIFEKRSGREFARRHFDFALKCFDPFLSTRNFDLSALSGCAVRDYQDVFVDEIFISPMPIVTPGDARPNVCRTPRADYSPPRFREFSGRHTPHTTAPLDYLIVSLSIPLKRSRRSQLIFAGAVVSPFLGLVAAGFFGGGRGE